MPVDELGCKDALFLDGDLSVLFLAEADPANREGEGFSALNRYKEKCFRIKPVMRELLAEGKLEGAPRELMNPMPAESLSDTNSDPHEIQNLATSEDPEHQAILREMRAALHTWMAETNDRGAFPEPEEITAPFTKEMHDWFGTPAWAK